MSLSMREQQVLGSIRDDLASCEPALVAQLTLFTRLASGEEMPAREKVQAGSRRADRRARPRRTGRAYQRLGLPQAVLLLWFVATVAVIAIALASNDGGGQGPCAGTWATTCTGATFAAHPGAGQSLNIVRTEGKQPS